eukprot:Sspe_Gene.25093::Locus_10043_Transcript_1_1_Confidence_1.000_Length_1642::g.25093::m.25093
MDCVLPCGPFLTTMPFCPTVHYYSHSLMWSFYSFSTASTRRVMLYILSLLNSLCNVPSALLHLTCALPPLACRAALCGISTTRLHCVSTGTCSSASRVFARSFPHLLALLTFLIHLPL